MSFHRNQARPVTDMRVWFIILVSTIAAAITYPSVDQSLRLNLVNLQVQTALMRENVDLFDLLSPTDSGSRLRASAANLIPADVPSTRWLSATCAMRRTRARLLLIKGSNSQPAVPGNDPEVCHDAVLAFQQSLDSAREGQWQESVDLMQVISTAADDTWINHLRLARESATMERWSESVDEYRLAMSLMGTPSAMLFPEYERVTVKWAETSPCGDGESWKCLYRLARSNWRLGDWKLARQSYESLVSALPQEITHRDLILAEAHDRIGQAAEQAGERDLAFRMYEQAWQEGRRTPDLYARLRNGYISSGDGKKLGWLEDEAIRWSPTYLVPSSDRLPSSGGWTLVGYEANQDDLEWGGPLEITYYWHNDDHSRIPNGIGWMLMSDKWALKQDAVNLVPNGSFEWSLNCGASPCGFSPIYPDAHLAVEKAAEESVGESDRFLRLAGSTEWRDSFIASPFVSLNQPGIWYLQAGRVRGSRAKLILGVLFHGSGANDPWQFTVFDMADEDWVQVTGIVFPPMWVNQLRVAVSNWKGTGPADFDDLIFISLPLPDRIETGETDALP